jgi:RNA polymerase subunit RPABC4/transcription elongation factor Spt4
MFCKSCGTEVGKQTRICPKCGGREFEHELTDEIRQLHKEVSNGSEATKPQLKSEPYSISIETSLEFLGIRKFAFWTVHVLNMMVLAMLVVIMIAAAFDVLPEESIGIFTDMSGTVIDAITSAMGPDSAFNRILLMAYVAGSLGGVPGLWWWAYSNCIG